MSAGEIALTVLGVIVFCCFASGGFKGMGN